jgi:hypothetical protein
VSSRPVWAGLHRETLPPKGKESRRMIYYDVIVEHLNCVQ